MTTTILVQGIPTNINDHADVPVVEGKSRAILVELHTPSGTKFYHHISCHKVARVMHNSNGVYKAGSWLHRAVGQIISMNVTVLGYTNGDDHSVRKVFRTIPGAVYSKHSHYVR